MTLRRHLIASSAAAVLAMSLTPWASAQTVLKASDVHPAGYPNVVAIENMGKKLEKATAGRYKLQMFPGGVLGSEKEVVEQTQIGAIQIARISLGILGPVVPDVNVFNMPFVFRDEAHMRAVIDGPVGKEILDKITQSPARLVALGFMDSGSRHQHGSQRCLQCFANGRGGWGRKQPTHLVHIQPVLHRREVLHPDHAPDHP
jgi:TRAP-type C4-dicarboxylate transport system substrate-binding protein